MVQYASAVRSSLRMFYGLILASLLVWPAVVEAGSDPLVAGPAAVAASVARTATNAPGRRVCSQTADAMANTKAPLKRMTSGCSSKPMGIYASGGSGPQEGFRYRCDQRPIHASSRSPPTIPYIGRREMICRSSSDRGTGPFGPTLTCPAR